TKKLDARPLVRLEMPGDGAIRERGTLERGREVDLPKEGALHYDGLRSVDLSGIDHVGGHDGESPADRAVARDEADPIHGRHIHHALALRVAVAIRREDGDRRRKYLRSRRRDWGYEFTVLRRRVISGVPSY